MNPALAAVAVITVAGAILAVSARDSRTTVLGILVVLLGAPLIADPWPGPVAILARVAASLLAVRLLAIGLRGDATTGGSRIGWPAEVLLAAAGAVVGFGSHGLGAAGLGPAEAQAAGFALVVLAVAPLLTGRDALRLAVGALLVLVAASLIRSGLDRSPSEAEHLVTSILTIALGGAIAVTVTAARAAGGLHAINAEAGGSGGRRPPDARRDPARAAAVPVPGRGSTPGRGPATPRPGRGPKRETAAPIDAVIEPPPAAPDRPPRPATGPHPAARPRRPVDPARRRPPADGRPRPPEDAP